MRDHEAIAAFSAGLPLRPEAERVRERLAAAFVAHVDAGNDGAPVCRRRRELPGAIEFLDRMSWLPPPLADLDRPRLDA
jgi:hypothetical protein